MSEKECISCGEHFEAEDGSEVDEYWYCDDCTTPIDCNGCDLEFTISEFAHIDDEYIKHDNLCPDCSEKQL